MIYQRKHIGFIIHDQFDMQKLSAKWMPKYFNDDQKQYEVDMSNLILYYFQ